MSGVTCVIRRSKIPDHVRRLHRDLRLGRLGDASLEIAEVVHLRAVISFAVLAECAQKYYLASRERSTGEKRLKVR